MIKMLTRLRNSIMRPVDAWCMKRCTRSLSATHGDFIYSPVLPPVIQFASDDFNAAWEQALSNVILRGKPITFGGKDGAKQAMDTMQTVVLGNHAVEQILGEHLHPKFPFQLVDQYLEEFTPEYLEKYRSQGSEGFDYIYYDRFDRDDQILYMRQGLREQIESGIQSNRNQMITWIPRIDQTKTATPCLQRVGIRYEKDDRVSVNLSWRSRDLFGAWQINLVGIINTLYRDIIDPNHCEIARIVDRNDSLHIYKSDMISAIGVITHA
jgi:thymidylate synthase